MKYNKIIFLRNDNQLVGIGIQPNGLKRQLTLDEAIREAGILKRANKENAIEYLNTKRKVENAKVALFNEKPKKKSKLNNKGVVALTVALALVGAQGTYALTKTFNGKATANVKVASTEESVFGANNTKNNEVSSQNSYSDVTQINEEFDKLLSASESETQIEYVKMMADYIKYFNVDFANTYKEVVDGEEIKPALSWNYEIPALTIAYNDLSKNEILQIFNGIELNANTLDANYKNATLQLFGAYVISDSSTPVRLYDLIESEEGKEFVKKYENMFYAIKDAKTEEAKIELIDKFYAEIYKDFPIDTELREEGISHIDARALMDNASYKLAITPMVTAMETMYQNLSYDRTLSTKAIEYFNDLGMCNIAYEKFQKVEFVLEDSKLNEKYADFGQLSKILIKELKSRDAYVIDDAHRDLSKLTSFQNIVNAVFNLDENGLFDGSFDIPYGGDTKTTTTHKRIKVAEWTETKITKKHETKETRTSDRDEAVDKAGEEKVKEAEDKVKEEINKENEKAKEEAEKEADQKQKEEQAKEDKKAEEKQKEADEANQKVQEDIQDINDKIDNNQPVNDNDYEGITFDDNHKDENGNLDNSVKDVTTDSTGANEALPDPKETGKEFDKKAESKPASTESTQSAPKSEPKAETKSETKTETKAEPKEEKSNDLPDPNETGKKFDEEANNIKSQEALIDKYIERMTSLYAKQKTSGKTLTR